MTPLFYPTGGPGTAPGGPGTAIPPPARRRGSAAPRRAGRRPGSRAQPGQANRTLVAVVKPGVAAETADLLTITADRLQRALWRSFLRYGVGDPDTAMHAAFNVIEPVLAARDAEILRLIKLTAARGPRR